MFISDEMLRVIHLVARHQSITTAAEQLNKVPSAISYTIKKAEESPALNCSFVRDAILNYRQREVTSSNIAKLFLATGSIKAQHSADSRWY